jgi:hypothetical protein
MSDKKVQSAEEVCQIQLDAYYRGRASHFLNNLLMPLIRHECKAPTQDVSSSPAMQFLVSAANGSQASAGKANLPN